MKKEEEKGKKIAILIFLGILLAQFGVGFLLLIWAFVLFCSPVEED